MAEVTVKIGTKLSEQEQQSVDMTKAVRLTPQPPPGSGVVGQDLTCQVTVCPACGCVGYGDTQSDYRSWCAVICHCCGYCYTVSLR